MKILKDDWKVEGNCWNTPTEWWFITEDTPGQRYHPDVKRLCDTCPVKVECLDFAIKEGMIYGYWAGTSPRERLKIAQERGVVMPSGVLTSHQEDWAMTDRVEPLEAELHAPGGPLPTHPAWLPNTEELQVCDLATEKHPQGRRGTPAGYSAHQDAGERPCDDCRLAKNESIKQDKARRRKAYIESGVPACATATRAYPQGRTGTKAGYAAHKVIGQKPCEPCRKAVNEYQAQLQRGYKKSRKGSARADYYHKVVAETKLLICQVPTSKWVGGRQGTIAGHSMHRRYGYPPCDPCREAYNEYALAQWHENNG